MYADYSDNETDYSLWGSAPRTVEVKCFHLMGVHVLAHFPSASLHERTLDGHMLCRHKELRVFTSETPLIQISLFTSRAWSHRTCL